MKTFEGALVYLADEIAETTVTVDGDTIVEIGGPVQGERIDGAGQNPCPCFDRRSRRRV